MEATTLAGDLAGLLPLVGEYRRRRPAQQRLDSREQASRIVMALRRHLTDAKFYRIGMDGQQVRFRSPRKIGRILFDDASGNIEIQPEGPFWKATAPCRPGRARAT